VEAVVLRKFEVLTITIVVSLSSFLFADQITLKNGDRLTGAVVKSDGKTLVLHTDASGDVTINYPQIQEIKTDKDLHVTLKGGKTVVGPVTTSDGKIEIATKTNGTVEAALTDVTVIRNDAEETAYEKTLHPGWREGWTGGANVGFSLARGNSETENLALAFNAARTTLHDKLTLYATSVDTKNDLAVPPNSKTVANLETGGLRYDHNLGTKAFVFGSADFMSNALQYLDLRQVYTGGFGWHIIKNDATQLDVLGGINYTHETYSNGAEVLPTPPATAPTGIYESYGVTNRFAAASLSEELTQKWGKSTVITQNMGFFPDLQNSSTYRATFNLGTVTKINKHFGWQNQFGNIYVSNPPMGTKRDDVLLTTGLNFTFTH
jgi:putative salt-induced outer membrane protein YdiY